MPGNVTSPRRCLPGVRGNDPLANGHLTGRNGHAEALFRRQVSFRRFRRDYTRGAYHYRPPAPPSCGSDKYRGDLSLYTFYSHGLTILTWSTISHDTRNKYNDVILVGLIAGPHEPQSINSFLARLVSDLLEFWS